MLLKNTKNIWEGEVLIKSLKDGGIVVMPTDTVYGIVTSAQEKSAVSRLYTIRKEKPYKPLIILIGDILDLEKFSIKVNDQVRIILDKYWPGPVSIIFDCTDEDFAYLTQGTNTITFRLPKEVGLQNLLKEVGPILAPSANLPSLPVSTNIQEAKNYFGDKVDLYVDGGEIIGKPSKIIKLHNDGSVSIIRE